MTTDTNIENINSETLSDPPTKQLVDAVECYKTTKQDANANIRSIIGSINEQSPILQKFGTVLTKSDINWFNNLMKNEDSDSVDDAINQLFKRLFILKTVLLASLDADKQDKRLGQLPYDRLANKVQVIADYGQYFTDIETDMLNGLITSAMSASESIRAAKDNMKSRIKSINEDFANTPAQLYIKMAEYVEEENPNRRAVKRTKITEKSKQILDTAKSSSQSIRNIVETIE